jgi:hypothetical protein
MSGQRLMGLFYFSLPVVGGYFVMQAAFRQSERNIGKNGEKLRQGKYNQSDGGVVNLERSEMQKQVIQRVLDRVKDSHSR